MSRTGNTDSQPYLEHLNEQQREAVLECGAPLLVLAGAGSGKTRVITTKIVHLIETLDCSPRAILAVTFTNKAAAEMKERVVAMTPGGENVMIRTFHSFGAWLLRRYGDRLALADSFTIYDDDDALTLLHSIYPRYKRTELKPYLRSISRAKDYCLAPDDDLETVSTDPKFPDMYTDYDRRLREIGNVDFGDLIQRSVELLARHGDIRDAVRNRFRAILVDEYQDSNVAQYQLLKQLADVQRGSFICVVGDDDQSIYRFRGAELMNILTFPDSFPGTRVIRLEENYRSTGNILKIAEEVVSNNRGRHGKKLWTRKPKGEKGKLLFFDDQFAEARYCADLVSRDHSYDNTAILYRTNAQSAAFETVFMRQNIPYKVVGALRFFEREEVKDALAMLSLLLNPADEVAFRRIVNKPPRGIGAVTLKHILDAAGEAEGNCVAGMRSLSAAGRLRGNALEGATGFLAWYDAGMHRLETGGSDLGELTREVLLNSGILEFHRRQDEISSTQKEQNLEELANAAGEYPSGREGLALFLESLELDATRIGRRDPADMPGVTLITMHNTKGLEFERVIITGMEEGLFPGRANESEEDIEEERRIFYVSITRAERELYFTACRQRSIWGRSSYQTPSRFLRELPPEAVQLVGTPPFGFDLPGLTPSGQHNRYGSIPARRRGSVSSRTTEKGYPGFGKQIPAADAVKGERETEKESGELEFSPGQRVFHDDYGSGTVTASRLERNREIVDVRFDTGQAAKFITQYARLEKIAAD